MTLEKIKEAEEVIKAYRQMLTDSVSNQVDGDIEAFDMAIEAMEGESCQDCVSRQAVFDALEKVAKLFPWRVPGKLDTYDSYNGAWNDAIGRAEMEIEGLPPVNPQKTGHWIKWYETIDTDICTNYIPHCKCSECGKEYDPHSSQFIKFCNECGAKMEEEE